MSASFTINLKNKKIELTVEEVIQLFQALKPIMENVNLKKQENINLYID